jgi:hypothetical protein
MMTGNSIISGHGWGFLSLKQVASKSSTSRY